MNHENLNAYFMTVMPPMIEIVGETELALIRARFPLHMQSSFGKE